jgi:hypothetical protein
VLLPRLSVQLISKDRRVTVDGLSPRRTYLLSLGPAKAGGRKMPVLVVAQGAELGRSTVDGVSGVAVLLPGEHLVVNTRTLMLVVPTATGIGRDDVLVTLSAAEEPKSGPRGPAKKASAGTPMLSSQVAEAKPLLEKAMKAIGAGQTAEARANLIRGLKLDPKNPGAHYWAGVLAQRAGDKTDALFQFRVFLQVASPDHPNREEVVGLLGELQREE